jgi:heme-degrading monooxygenase HmoA
MGAVWTLGTYRVKRGCEDEFVRVWRELARHAVAEFGASSPTFLRDREDTSVFVTFGVWDGLETLQRFRASPPAVERGRVLGDLLEEGEARILEEVGVDD